MATHNEYMIEPAFTAELRGQYEVPPVDTHGQGSALLRRVGKNRVNYTLSVSGLDDITEAHVHQGAPGRNGPVVAWLFGPTTGTTISGVLARGTIRRGDLVGPLNGRPISSLVRMMKNGNAYVNVHTRRYPNGEIRGQVRTSGRTPVSTSGDWWQYGGMSLS